MSDWLFPRLHGLGELRLLEQLEEGVDLNSAVSTVLQNAHFFSYAESGGRRVSNDVWGQLFQELGAVASLCGYPDDRSQAGRARFDALAGARLVELDLIPTGEALRDDVWAAISCCLVPHLVQWRFGELKPERLRGGVRNTFQRLWMRAVALDRGAGHPDRWGLLTSLTEDALVQISERPSIGADPRLARAVGEGWVRMSQRIGQAAMEAVMRRAIRNLRIRNEVIALSLLDDDSLQHVIDRFFEEVLSDGSSEADTGPERASGGQARGFA
jgi:hypothetical protein